MSQEVKSLNFAAEANYTIRLCKEIVAYHYPDKMPLGSFELVASNKVRSDEETLAEVFNGSAYACEKEVAEDPCFDWVPRKEQIFDEHKLMQLSIWKKEWDADAKCFEPVDLGCADAPLVSLVLAACHSLSSADLTCGLSSSRARSLSASSS